VTRRERRLVGEDRRGKKRRIITIIKSGNSMRKGKVKHKAGWNGKGGKRKFGEKRTRATTDQQKRKNRKTRPAGKKEKNQKNAGTSTQK